MRWVKAPSIMPIMWWIWGDIWHGWHSTSNIFWHYHMNEINMINKHPYLHINLSVWLNNVGRSIMDLIINVGKWNLMINQCSSIPLMDSVINVKIDSSKNNLHIFLSCGFMSLFFQSLWHCEQGPWGEFSLHSILGYFAVVNWKTNGNCAYFSGYNESERYKWCQIGAY